MERKKEWGIRKTETDKITEKQKMRKAGRETDGTRQRMRDRQRETHTDGNRNRDKQKEREIHKWSWKIELLSWVEPSIGATF